MPTECQSPFLDGFKEGVRPPKEMSLGEWATENVYLPNSTHGARYSLEAVPAHRFILDAFQDPEIYEINVIACVGFGKTAIIEACNTFIVAEEPGDTLIVGQTDATVQDWCESRMRKIWEISPCTRGYIPIGAERSNWKKDSVGWRHMHTFMGGANKTNLQEKSMRYTFGDEVWRWEQDGKSGMIGYLLKRHHGRWNRKSLLQSQGGYEGGEWHQHCKDGKWHEFEHFCPSCNMGHVFDWNNFQYDKIKDANEEYDWPAIFETIRLKCPHCGEEFQDTERNRRAWANCKPVWDGGKFIPKRCTFRATFMCVWRYEWKDIVREWIIANEDKKTGKLDKLEQITNQRFAQFWKPPSDVPTLSMSGDPYAKNAYHEGEKWEGEDFRFLTADCQKGHFWVIVRACKIGGASRLLWEGRVESWENIRHLQDRYGLENRFVFVDARWRPEEAAKQAHLARKSHDMNPWNLLMGDQGDGYIHTVGKKKFRRIFSQWVNSQSSDGIQYRFIKFSNLLAKDRLAALMSGGDFGIPVDASKHYHAHMQSEQKREKSPGKWVWEPVKSHTPNHLWDCEVMCVVAMAIYGVLVAHVEVTD